MSYSEQEHMMEGIIGNNESIKTWAAYGSPTQVVG